MALRKPADPAARLALLLAGQKRIRNGDILSMADMATALDMTQRNLKLTIDADPDFPIVSRGGEGVAWQLDAGAVFKHMIAKCQAVIAERKARLKRMNRLTSFRGSSPPLPDAAGLPQPAAEGGETPLAPQDLKQLGEAQMTAHKLKMLQGQFMPVAETTAFLLDYHSEMQAKTLGILGKIDPAGQWPPEVRKMVNEEMRNTLVGLQTSMDTFLTRYRVPAAA
jgi:hypothetical protein